MPWTVYNSDGQILQGSSTLADDAVTTAKILDDAVTYVKLQNLATADRVLGSESTGVIGEVQIVPDMIASNAVTTAKILDANVTLAKIASQAANTVLVRDASSSGVVSAKAVTDTQILIGDGTGFTAAALSGDVTMANSGATTIATDAVDIAMLSATGTASSSTFLRGDNAWVAAGGDLSFGGDTFGADKVIGSNDAYSLSFETAGVVRMKIHGPVTNPTSAGAITMPTQPCVIAYNSANDIDISGDGAIYTLDYNIEVTDQGGDFASDVFTAPVTGTYFITASLRLEGLTDSSTNLQLQATASNRNWDYIDNINTNSNTNGPLFFSALIDMDTSDTVYFQYQATGESSNRHDIIGMTNNHTTYCSMILVA